MNLVRTFQLVAAILGCIAIYLTFTDPRSDYLFAAVILTICAAFLSYRFYLKDRLPPKGRDLSGSEGAPWEVIPPQEDDDQK